jgi:TP901 family phage tail tape measure protein
MKRGAATVATDEITILLLLEAVDKASGVIGKIGQAFTNLGDTLQKASDISARTAEEQAALDDQVTASTAAWTEATNLQTDAQMRLRAANEAVQEAQAQAVEWARIQMDTEKELAGVTRALTEEEQFSAKVVEESFAAATEAVKAATTVQIEALDALQAAQTEVAIRSQEMAAAESAASRETGLGAAALGGLKVAAATTAIGVGAVAYMSTKAAANFQSMTTTLATSGGEMDKTGALLATVRNGILNLAQSTGTATDQLTKGMYMIGSAGFTGAKGLEVLRAAAEGAKAENSDLGTVANALTTVMLDYGNQIDKGPVQAMNLMIATVQRGKMTTQDFAGSLASILPIANSAGLKFAEVGGALATMTASGMTAQRATDDLSNSVRALQKPNNVAIQLMQQMGIDSNKLVMDLGKNGLTGTLNTLLQAIAAHTKGGQVLLNTWYTSASAAADLKTMIASMTPAMQALANGFQTGSLTAKQFRDDLYQLSPRQRDVMMQFESLANKADGFNQQLKLGNPAAITFNNALGTMMGGATGLNTALILSANNGKTFANNVAAIGAAAQNTGTDVNGWSLIQQNFNQQLSQLKETVQVAAIRIGTALLPAVTKIVEWIAKVIQPIAEWISHHQKLSAVIMIAVGVLSTLLVMLISAVKIFKEVKLAIEGLGVALDFLADNPIILIIAAIAVAAYLIITHWSTVKKWLEEFWGWIVKVAKIAAHYFVQAWNESVETLKRVWGDIKRIWDDTGGKAVTWIKDQFEKIAEPIKKEWDHIVSDLESIWGSLTEIWNGTGGKLVHLISAHWKAISDFTKLIWQGIYTMIKVQVDIIVQILKVAWELISSAVKVQWDLIKGILKTAWDLIYGLIKGTLDVIIGVLKAAWDIVVGIFRAVWDIIKVVINTALDYIKDVLKLFADLVTGQWGKLWNDVKKIFTDLWNNIKDFFVNIWHDIEDTASSAVSNVWNGFVSGTKAALGGITSAITDVYNTIKNFFADAYNWLIDAGKAILNGFVDGAKSVWNDVTSFFGGFGDWIAKHKGPIEVDMKLLVPHGQAIMKGLMDGLQAQMPALQAKLGQVTSTVTASVNPVLRTSGALSGFGSAPTSASTQPQIVITNDLRESRIMSDRDMDMLTQKIGNRLATQLLPAGGVRIRS